MRSWLKLLKRELQIITNDHTLLLTLLIAPVLYAFFYGSIYVNKEQNQVKIGVVDADGTHLTRLLVEKINSTEKAEVIAIAELEEAKEKMFEGEIQGFLYLESGMEEKVLSLKQSNAILTLNSSRFLPSSDLMSTITEVTMTVGAGVRLEYFKKTGKGSELAMVETNPIQFNHKPLYNAKTSYGDFLLPGLLALILQQTLLIGLSESMSSEREENRLTGMLKIANGSYSSLLWGKGLWYFILYCSYAFFFFTINFNILNLELRGTPFDLGVLTALFLLTIIPLGLWIGSLFKSQLLAMQMMAFSTYPIFLITGYSLPFEALPEYIQWVANLVPTTPFLKAYNSIVQAGGSLFENLHHFIHLVALWLFYSGLFIFRFKRLEKKTRKIENAG